MTSTGQTILDKCRFSYVFGIQKQWVEINAMFLDYMSSRYGQSAKAYIEDRDAIVAEVDERVLPKFDAEAIMKAHVAGLKH